MASPTNLPTPPYTNRGSGEYAKIRCIGSASLTPGAITTGSVATGTVTVTGATLGDFVDVSYAGSLGGCTLSATVSTGDTVTWVISNNTGSTQTPTAASTLAIVVYNYPAGLAIGAL